MTYDQLLPVYQKITGLPGQDDAFNQWVQGVINKSGSTQGVAGIPNDFFNTPNGQGYVAGTTTVVQPNTVSPSGGFGDLLAPTPNAPGFTQAPTPTAAGGNYNQVQNATQGGQFGTVGTNYNQQTGTTGQTQTGSQNTSGTQNTNTQNNQNTTSTQNQVQDSRTTGTVTDQSSGTQTEQAIDSLGFGQLLKDQAGGTIAADGTRRDWLTDVMQNGGSGFNSQVDEAIRNSLTGPQMTGAGDSARARAASYGASNVARNNLNQRLAASEQLAGKTGLTTLSEAANPFVGKTTNTSGTNTSFQDLVTKGNTATTGTQNTSGTQNSQSLTNQLQNSASNTTGFQDLVSRGTEMQAGTTQGQSSQSGAGNIPQGQPVKTGGCVLCTAGIALHLPKANMHRVLRRVINHKLNVDRSTYASAARGYFAVFTPVARTLLSYPTIARVLFPLARATVYEELRISGRRLRFRLIPFMVHGIGHGVCAAVGRFFPVVGHVTDPVINDIARRENISFVVGGAS
jgi:hypothetical protein